MKISQKSKIKNPALPAGKQKSNYQNKGFEWGQSLWEVIIALAIASLIALGLVKATGSAVRGSRFSADQSQLTALAQEKIAKIVDCKNKFPVIFWNSYASNQNPIWDCTGIEKVDKSLNDTCFKTKINDGKNDWPGGSPPPNAKMAIITVDVFWGAKNNNPDCDTSHTGYSHSLHFETNVTN